MSGNSVVYSLSGGAELSIWWGVVLSDSESHRGIAFIAIIIFVSTIKNASYFPFFAFSS